MEKLQVYQQTFEGGINTYVPDTFPARQLEDNEAYRIVNFNLLGNRLVRRRNDKEFSAANYATRIFGLFYNQLTAPKGTYVISNDKHLWVDGADKGVTDVTQTAQFVLMDGRVFFCGNSSLYSYTAGGGLVNETTANSAPKGYALCVHKLRLFVAGYATGLEGTLYYSELGTATGWTINGQDDFAGYIDIDDITDPITNLLSFYDTLVLFKQKKVYYVLGSNPQTLSVQLMVSGIGCVSNNGSCVAGRKYFFVDSTGVFDESLSIPDITSKLGYATFTSSSKDSYLVFNDYHKRLYFLPSTPILLVYDLMNEQWTDSRFYDTGSPPVIKNIYGVSSESYNLYFGKTIGSNINIWKIDETDVGFVSTVSIKTRMIGGESDTYKFFRYFTIFPNPSSHNYNVTNYNIATISGLTYDGAKARGALNLLGRQIELHLDTTADKIPEIERIEVYYTDTGRRTK